MMNRKAAGAATILLALTFPTFAQDHSGHGAPAEVSVSLPDICITEAGRKAADAMPVMDHGGSTEAQHALMAGMDKMNRDMMLGGLADDIDVAFVCSMIPHHQGAIDMARAELDHGDDPWVRDMAQKVITAQEREIADMLEWLEGQK